MGVKVRRSTNNIPRMKKLMKKLGKVDIEVGIFGSDGYTYGTAADMVTIAAVHEYGTTIKPKNAEWLTLPLIPAAKGKRASDFPDLVFYKTDDDTAFLGRKVGKEMQNVFILVKSVTIPERSFIRTGFDKNVDKIGDKIEQLMQQVIDFNIDPDTFANMIGLEFAGLIQKHTRSISSPPNAGLTAAVKGSSNPLNDTGRLIGAIRHEVK
ncbi:tail completion protein [Bacillus phage vB_BcM_Sam46]|uniref:Tail completion protein n=2 Tax=Caudoviricetes TaxID=2731619 RepID=A0A6G9L6L4_9CAUD|nr:tail completion protein [Bacillus phage vB_BcM_Sam112]QIQ61210.1 tail completion protein [Bacillus phage vB_BcM_Sam46]